jgi:hypothetical protein
LIGEGVATLYGNVFLPASTTKNERSVSGLRRGNSQGPGRERFARAVLHRCIVRRVFTEGNRLFAAIARTASRRVFASLFAGALVAQTAAER